MRGRSKAGRIVLIGIALMLSAAAGGCSRRIINYQVAESIGTLGKYDNNEPVETPRMREAREQAEALKKAEDEFAEQMAQAKKLADGYFYDEAVAYLETLEKNELTTDSIEAAMEDYKSRSGKFRTYDGKIPHLCFPALIEDTDRAFDGDEASYTYSGTMLTTTEFKSILQQLYDNDYLLIDIHDIARIETDGRGISTMEMQKLRIPEGKKPVILSQDNVNYSMAKAGDGMATKLALDRDGKVKALYTDPDGHDLKGDYDFVPILESFIDEHPDFSLKGARGIISVSASEGLFGYSIKDTVLDSAEENQQTVKAIADKLKADGWYIACAGYNHAYMNEMTVDALRSDIENWEKEAGTLVGASDILFYPYGAEVGYPSDQLKYLLDTGFCYLCGLWGDTDFMEKGEGYLRQTRRFVDGYTLTHAASYFTGLFDASQARDPGR